MFVRMCTKTHHNPHTHSQIKLYWVYHGRAQASLKLNLLPRVLSRHERVGHNSGNEVCQTIRFIFSSQATCTAIFLIHYTHHTLSFGILKKV